MFVIYAMIIILVVSIFVGYGLNEVIKLINKEDENDSN